MPDDPTTTTETEPGTPDEQETTRTRTRPRRTTRASTKAAKAPATADDEPSADADAAGEDAAPAPKRRRRASTTPRKSRAKAAPVEDPATAEEPSPPATVAEDAGTAPAVPEDGADAAPLATEPDARDQGGAATPLPEQEPAAELPSVGADVPADGDGAAAAPPPVPAGEGLVDAVEAPGSLDEPQVEVAPAAEEPPVTRRRRRRRAADPEAAATAEPTEPPLPDADADAVADDAEATGGQVAVVEPAPGADPAAAGPGDADPTPTPPAADTSEPAADVATEPEVDEGAPTTGDATSEDTDDGRPKSSRRRRRGGRGRGRRGRGTDGTGQDADASPDAPAEATAGADVDTSTDDTTAASTDGDDGGDGRSDAPPTRLSAGGRRSGGRGRTGSGPRARTRSGRVLGGVSEETRRAIADGPPKKMLVTVGQQRTQIVVMEERNLVEHYVTRREDASYVGNVYVGRVQNVLPGMEAAFVDIGKGRNGVLYAGEVNYDEADLDGELPRIEQTLKPGQTVLVQVTKDPMGTKGARLTQQLSIAGRYCVLAPGDGMLGISRKLSDDERERLRKLLKSIKPEQYGLIVRTAAEGATKEQLEADVARLVRIWGQVEARAADASPLESVYEEPDLVIRVIRDVFGPEFTDLIVDDEVLAEQIRTYLGDVSPELTERVSVQRNEEALFDGYEVTNQVRRALEKKVWLKSGGYLIVEKTEAMWVIDVNTGKFVGKSNLEETVLRNNIEAAQEIARQLRLRDMGGIIVIDFVDMLVPANRDEVLKRFKRELARDKTKSRVMEISKLGLVQMTRKNVSQGLNESFTTVCDCCEGRGAQIVPSILG